MFQSTLPYGERRSRKQKPRSGKKFQSTLPYGERPFTAGITNTTSKFQSTLPYGERLDDPFCNGWHRFVSIHAPVWGATLRRLTNGREGFGFNPRSRMGSDSFYLLSYKCINVSIHAPVWGATNPVCINADCRKFQSTLPYGERRIHCSGFAEYQKVSIHAPVWGATFWILY